MTDSVFNDDALLIEYAILQVGYPRSEQDLSIAPRSPSSGGVLTIGFNQT